jgi:hypothetical protein
VEAVLQIAAKADLEADPSAVLAMTEQFDDAQAALAASGKQP